ncbi:hypothetical protein GH741_10640 [Aquibacillus halophilus]|uniref:Competence protein ComGF n=1 Tax=Aquibacillus halophilus TaxID=930132 RepID=A0A6A8DF35_9BACI|nr:competence type IV pilus minor pilin ComGF [Aquibacillus halophilus]MRH43136.1 hypothetical protein [Aquibacillus halophilus]
MKKIDWRIFACMDSRNNKGFTLVSLLLSLSIIFITLPLLPFILNSIEQESYYEEISIRQFFHFVNVEFHSAVSYSTVNSIVNIQKGNGEIVTIEKYQSLVRRRVAGQGHEVLVRDIKEFLIKPISNGIKIEVTTLEGDTYEKTFSFTY